MNEKLKETFLLYSSFSELKEKIKNAKEIIKEAIKQNEGKGYVAYSGGKDSTCLLHLVLQENPEVMVLHWDFGRYFIPREIHKEIIENAKKIGAKNIRIETSEKYEKYKRRAINVLGSDYLGKLIPRLFEEGYTYSFIGLRAEESYKRKRIIKKEKQKVRTTIKEYYPLAEWTWLDVWSYIVSNNLPYLSFYDTYGEVIGYDNVRFTTLFDSEFDKYGASNIDGVLSWRYRHIK